MGFNVVVIIHYRVVDIIICNICITVVAIIVVVIIIVVGILICLLSNGGVWVIVFGVGIIVIYGQTCEDFKKEKHWGNFQTPKHY
jgi:hypothetical protein